MPTNTGQRAASTAVILALMAGVLAMPAYAQRYSAVQHDDVVTLADRETDTVVTVVPSVGNIATEMRVKGHNVLRYPHASLAEFRERPGATGIPFMGPWINRLDEQAFYANGRRHAFDMSLGNVRGEVPIHGFVTGTNLWRVVSVEATVGEASVTSRLDFYRQPSWMRQWPYAHTVEMTYRLIDGVLEVYRQPAPDPSRPCRARWCRSRWPRATGWSPVRPSWCWRR